MIASSNSDTGLNLEVHALHLKSNNQLGYPSATTSAFPFTLHITHMNRASKYCIESHFLETTRSDVRLQRQCNILHRSDCQIRLRFRKHSTWKFRSVQYVGEILQLGFRNKEKVHAPLQAQESTGHFCVPTMCRPFNTMAARY